MIQANYYEKNDDLKEHFEHIIDWKEIVDIYENNFADAKEYSKSGNSRLEMAPNNLEEAIQFYQEILRSAGEVSGMYVSQAAQEIDYKGLNFENGVVTHPEIMVEMIRKYQEAGLIPVAFQRKYGGLGVPNVVKAIITEIMYRSDTSTTIATSSIGLAVILEKVATEEMCQELIPKFIDENYSGTMGLSEPDFGSDLPEVKTKAIPDPNNPGKWLLTGNKRYQTLACGVNGGPGMTLVLARTGTPESGARGLSFFIAENKDYEITGIEKKLGLKASATCEVAYENTPAILVGQQNYGLVKYVMGMLNGARLSVSSQGTGISTAAFCEAEKYAKERIQFGKPIIEIPAVKKMLDYMEREIAAMRCFMIEAAYSVDKYLWIQDRNLPKDSPEFIEAKFWEKVANTLTPISKYYNSETGIQVVNTGLQVLGGAGYTEDYDLARLYRDIRITNIYDGTTQIQVNAAIGGITAGMSASGVFREYIERLEKQGSGSKMVQSIKKSFEEVVTTFKNIESRETKEKYSFEVVESAARLLLSLLMDRAYAKSSEERKAVREKWNQAFHIDSLAICQSNLLKLNHPS
ncbi:acyl-CoA dehydrogenase family protein [Leptospira sp. GIMC2001]|uniref:acyl-CoA dehydrogenase family protein n=1 Tax=Leptospira sp. GIMC2001 TaxID=1513297 RepID=UPI00234BF46E|nr:acyl-CoA dehydrogenase family protein [Leptospira sp. GIMC2001]WCL48980.1 acyl-CoA dehydrogenase family protein [Leptospira sp. GIMC2001]